MDLFRYHGEPITCWLIRFERLLRKPLSKEPVFNGRVKTLLPRFINLPICNCSRPNRNAATVKRLEILQICLGPDEAVFVQWRHAYLLEYFTQTRRHQYWGWKQNSLVSVDTVKTYCYNYEYYLIKISVFIQPGQA
jgi:hypothetical protein